MDIYNWDMVCAVSCTALNKKLKAASRAAFGQFSWSDNKGNKISGEFDGWEIVAGGDPQRINIITPLRTGRLEATILGHYVDREVNGLHPGLQVELAFINAGHGDNTTHLKFNFSRVSKISAVTMGEGYVVVSDPDTTRLFPASESIIPEMYSDMMAEMLVSMRNKLEFIFAEIMDVHESCDISWMKPHLLQYAYNEKIKGELGCMAVLGILADNPSPPEPGSLQLIFDSSLIPEGRSIGFMLSQRMFMEHIVLPGLPEVFEGSNISQFSLKDNNVIRNNGSISLNKVDGYIPYFNSLNVEIVDDRVILNNASGSCDVVSYSSYVSFYLSAIYAPKLTRTGGQYTLSLGSVTSPSFHCETHDTLAQIFWIFGGWVVDALVKGIKSQLNYLLFEFGYNMEFDLFPVTFSTDAIYEKCGLADNFYMCD